VKRDHALVERINWQFVIFQKLTPYEEIDLDIFCGPFKLAYVKEQGQEQQ
jgi:hypothetical protein